MFFFSLDSNAFTDDFADDFGHFTKAGAELVAEQAAAAVRAIVETRLPSAAVQSKVTSGKY